MDFNNFEIVGSTNLKDSPISAKVWHEYLRSNTSSPSYSNYFWHFWALFILQEKITVFGELIQISAGSLRYPYVTFKTTGASAANIFRHKLCMKTARKNSFFGTNPPWLIPLHIKFYVYQRDKNLGISC